MYKEISNAISLLFEGGPTSILYARPSAHVQDYMLVSNHPNSKIIRHISIDLSKIKSIQPDILDLCIVKSTENDKLDIITDRFIYNEMMHYIFIIPSYLFDTEDLDLGIYHIVKMIDSIFNKLLCTDKVSSFYKRYTTASVINIQASILICAYLNSHYFGGTIINTFANSLAKINFSYNSEKEEIHSDECVKYYEKLLKEYQDLLSRYSIEDLLDKLQVLNYVIWSDDDNKLHIAGDDEDESN